MTELIAAAVFFAGIHLLISGTRLRDALAARIGAKAYLALFSLASIAGLAAMIIYYGRVRVPIVTSWLDARWLAALLNFVALTLVVYGVTSRGPTAVGGGDKLGAAATAGGIHRITRHPMLWGFMLWAATHMAFNPQAVNLIFFGTFLVVALAGTFAIDAKRARAHGSAWAAYAASTSNLPFLAIAQGRNQFVASELGWIRPLVCLALFAVLVMLHLRFFGLPAI